MNPLLPLHEFAAQVVPFPLSPLDLEILHPDQAFGVLNCHRRLGKTTLFITLVVGPTQEQSDELVVLAAWAECNGHCENEPLTGVLVRYPHPYLDHAGPCSRC